MKNTVTDGMRHYRKSVAWSDEDESFVATCAEFPGLSGIGDSEAEALAELGTALEAVAEVYAEEGRPLPEPKTPPGYSGQFRLRLPKSLHAQLAEAAALEGVSLNTMIVTLLAGGSRDGGSGERVS